MPIATVGIKMGGKCEMRRIVCDQTMRVVLVEDEEFSDLHSGASLDGIQLVYTST